MRRRVTGASGHRVGVGMATIGVAGNLIGSGIYLLPATLGLIGSISIYGWIISAVGALALAAVFSLIFAYRPTEDGLSDIARDGMGPFWGFHSSLIYWFALILGLVAISLAVTGYLTVLFPPLDAPGLRELTTVVVVWLMTLVAILGAKAIGSFHGLTLAVGLAPLLVVGLLGWLWFDPEIYAQSWNVSGESDSGAVMGSLVSVFWAFLGMECAAMVARTVENPRRNVPLATMGGIVIAGVIYVLAATAIFGIIPARELAASSAPFALAVDRILGPAAAGLVAICAILKASGTLAGWILVTGETTRWTAAGGALPRWLSVTSGKGNALRALLFMGVLMTICIVATASPTLAEQFGLLINASVVFSLLCYIYAAIALVTFTADKGGKVRALAIAVAAISILFCVGLILTSGTVLIVTGIALALATVPLWFFVKRRIAHPDGPVAPQ